MSRRKIYLKNPESCTGCRICEIICSLVHEKNGINPRMSRIRVHSFPDRGRIIPDVCRLCTNPLCIPSCPEGALTQNSLGIITVNEENCTGCGNCVEACKFNVIFLHPVKHTAIACDLCGGNPLCVKYCMNDTLLFLTPEEYRAQKKKAIIR